MMRVILPLLCLWCGLIFLTEASAKRLEDPYVATYTLLDTVPEVQDRFGNHITNPSTNPFDLNDPGVIEKNVEYDPITGQYIITEKIGDDDYRPPTYLSFEEYLEYRKKQDERDYFNRLAGISDGKDDLSAVDPIAKFDVKSSLLDRLFGGTTVDIRPQGGIDLTFGVDFQTVENPILTRRQQRQGGFDFDMNIQMNVTGKIGEKLNLTTNYNTNATFDFDNQIKLDYNSDQFSEDEIIKKIEAGNVSLPLRGSLIQGAQSLFGVKTEMQFGHLRLTAIASQQRSQRENIQIQGGAQVQKFEVLADQYDENRHFFLSHYNRGAFEEGLKNLPQVNTLFKIKNLEVWITNDRNEVDNVREIVALADLGEPTRLVAPDKIVAAQDPKYQEICAGNFLPANEANDLYGRLIDDPRIRDIDQAVQVLTNEFGLVQSRDFEKVSARKLDPNEYTFNADLGFISVNVNVQPDQVLAVGFQYVYNGNNFQVGELAINSDNVSTDTTAPPKVQFVKMLKSTTQRTDVPTWDLMMKNVYSIGAFQVNQEDFKLDVFYQDPGAGDKRFLPSSNLEGIPLIRVFNLDNLNVQGDNIPDGRFDFVPGVTINPRNGRIMFPVLEPFGSFLEGELTDQASRDRFVYNELYDRTVFQAREFAEKNLFVIRGEYKSSVSSEISLGAFNIPRGSVSVRAGGQLLREGFDYEIDYNIGRIKILNDAYLNSGAPINVSFEDNTLFGFQTKTMLGLRADYEFSDDFNIGATYLQLFERPFTQKVNVGDDPINNRIYGLDVNFSKDAPWLTKAVDAIPFLNTKQPSNITVAAEAAYLQPGHSRAINQPGVDEDGIVYIDDFEGSASAFDLRQPTNQWFLASVPQNDEQNNNPMFPESREINSLISGSNRALLNWYRIDQQSGLLNSDDQNNPYTSIVPQEEVFPNIQLTPDQFPNIQTLDLRYYPEERGPYNFDVPDGYPGFSAGVDLSAGDVRLREPESRWGGIMRALNTNDFQAANIEFLEFWMLSPFHDPENPDSPDPEVGLLEGDLFIELGNISEDIMRDSRQFYENGLPGPINPDRRTDETVLSRVPVSRPITRAFDNDNATREVQDVGLDGFNNEGEREHFREYLDRLGEANAVVAATVEEDPANDDYVFFRDPNLPENAGVYDRYRLFNNTEGNSQANTGDALVSSATNIPDMEDLNQDFTLNETESYFQYRIEMRNDPGTVEFDERFTDYITDKRTVTSNNGQTERVWYRFRIPLDNPDARKVGGIQDFRSIRFIRMYMKGFRKPVTLRFARLELVRNQWRRYLLQQLEDIEPECGDIGFNATTFDVDAVNIEENSSREPFNYVLPEGIQREQSLGVFNALQNEQSISMNIQQLCGLDTRSIYKILNMDMRVYERMKMFVHAESLNPDVDIPPGDLSIFIRLGSDFRNNYYEYEIPLVMSDTAGLPMNNSDVEYKREVWRQENGFDFPLSILRDVKVERNDGQIPLDQEFVREVEAEISGALPRRVKVRGNPNLGLVKVAMIGVRNNTTGANLQIYDTEVWANELRLTGLDERGGLAALARIDMQLADFGNVTLAGNYSSIGFGALDQKLQQRQREEIVGYDVSGSFEVGKFFPEDWGLRIPFYGQYSQQIKTPQFDPYDLDIELKDKIANAETQEERDQIREISQDVTTIKSYTLTNVRKERTNSDKKPMPWNIENFSASYAYTETDHRDPIIESDNERQYSGSLDYNYSRPPTYIEPFKKLIKNDKYLKFISQFGFNPLPNSFGFSTVINRNVTLTRYRFTDVAPKFSQFFIRRFTWDRDYNLQWDLTKSLKLNFNATNKGVIDEPDDARIAEDPTIADLDQYRRDSIWAGIQDFGRTKNYRHNININYDLPLKNFPFLDWIKVKASYQADYSWNAAALNVVELGNTIQNNQNRQIDFDFNLEGLYNKSKYLKKLNQGSRSGGRRRGIPGRTQQKDEKEESDGKKKKKKTDGPSIWEKALIRPLMLIRKARFSYSERFQTVVPGFLPSPDLLGLSSGFDAPGVEFILGLQPKIRGLSDEFLGNDAYYDNPNGSDWLLNQSRNGWFTESVELNQEVIQNYTQEWDARLTLEPFTDFRIDIEANRSFTENYSEYFKDLDKEDGIYDPRHTIPFENGSMNISYFALNTMFDDSREQIIGLFNRFEDNRVIISQRLGQGLHSDTLLADAGFTDGFGRTQQDVLIPAFIAAYTDQDPNSIGLDIFNTMPLPNWRLSYNGLTKLPWFKDIFQNFNLTHGYKSTLGVNRFGTSLPFLQSVNDPDLTDRNPENDNFYARVEIPEVAIQESFAPLLAIDMTLNNGMSLNVDYKKSRTLAMSFISNQLSETQTEEFVIGFGYLLKDVNFGFLKGKRRRGKKKKEEEQQQNNGRGPGPGTRGGQLEGRDLDISFNLSIRDDVTFNHLLDQGIIEPTRGTYALSLSPAAEYKLNKRLSLRLFFDYRRNIPKTSAGFPRTDTSGGVVVRFTLD